MRISLGANRFSQAAVKKTTMLMALFAAVFLVTVLSIGVQNAYADGETVLTVKLDGEIRGELTYDDLDAIAAGEGNKTYTYSAWNTFPTFDMTTYENVKGATVRGILEFAGVYNEITSEATIKFTDGVYWSSFTGHQLFEEPRYFYPNGKLANPTEGPAPDASYVGAVQVDAIIYDTRGNEKLKNLIGQAAPNDENNPAFCKYLKTIEISTAEMKKCDLPEPSIASESICSKGQTIDFNYNNNNNRPFEYIYYTLDGSEPDYGSQLYNSGMNQDLVTAPKLSDYGDYTIKVKVKGYGKADSDVGTYTYHVRPEAPAGIEASATYDRVDLSWEASPDAKGYNIYRSVAGGDYALLTSVGAGTLAFTDTEVTPRTLYSYQVAAVDYSQNGTAFENSMTVETETPCNHIYGELVVDTPPTCGSAGTGHRVCSVCQHEENEEIPATGEHIWNPGYTVDQPATEHSPGIQSIHCAVCGVSKAGSAIGIPQLGPVEIQDLKAVKISKPKAAKKKVTVKWKKVSKKDQKKIGGIEIQIAADSGFTQIVKSTTAKKSKTNKTIKGLNSKTTYWVRIRAYKNATDGKHVSAWKTKKVKIR